MFREAPFRKEINMINKLSNGLTIELVFSEDNAFKGIGKVSCDGYPLRNGRRPMFVEIRTPDGFTMQDYRVTSKTIDLDGIQIQFSMRANPGGHMEWMVHTVRSRVNVSDWSTGPLETPETTLTLKILPVSRTVKRVEYKGFSYQYNYHSEPYPIYKILDRSTWEPGGSAIGCEWRMRHCMVPSLVEFETLKDFYSSEWYLPGIHNPNIFQFFPLQTELQGFTLTSSDAGTLVTWPTKVAHIRSLFEKQRGGDEMVHLHEHCGDLSSDFLTTPVEVLYAPGATERVDRLNRYDAVRDFVWQDLNDQIGMRRERVTSYGFIEEWGIPDIERYAREGVPKLLEAGIKKIGLANHFENNMNVYGVSNMCCTLDYKVAENVGEDALHNLCKIIQAGGAKTEMWGNTSISSLTEIFSRRNGPGNRIRFLPDEGSAMQTLKSAPQPWVRNPSGAIEADHYTPVFCVMNLRDQVVRDFWMDRWKYAHDHIGLEGIFLDSSFNLSSDKFHFQAVADVEKHSGATADQVELLGHFRPEHEPKSVILSQYRAHLDLMVEMQRAGYDYCSEDLGAFGICRHGPGVAARLDTLDMWTECVANFDIAAIQKAGADPDDIFFKALAYRMMWIIFWDIENNRLSHSSGAPRGEYDFVTADQIRLIKVFNAVNDIMVDREILPDERGVMYRQGDIAVLWVFEDMSLSLDSAQKVVDVMTGEETITEMLKVKRHHVYRIDKCC